MAEIWIWNSMARRRRSASDTFEENGIQLIKSHLEKKGHKAQVFDWATDKGYSSLSPSWLKKLNRKVFEQLITCRAPGAKKTLLSVCSILLQKALDRFQRKRMARRLTQLARVSKQQNIRLFGIKVWYGEAYDWSRYLARKIEKINPGCIVIAGGYHATLYEEDILRYSNFDLAVAHEGEYTLTTMLDQIDELQHATDSPSKQSLLQALVNAAEQNHLPGLIYRKNGEIKKVECFQSNEVEIETDKAIPFYTPDSGKTKVHILMESLGCPWNKCHFCVHNQFTPIHRTRKTDDLIREIEAMIEQDIGLFRLTGSDTTHFHGRIIAQAILQKGLHIEFTLGSRVVKNCFKPEVFAQVVDSYSYMIRAGLRAVFIGGESGNDVINHKVMNKGVNREEILHTIRAIREAETRIGIKVTISLALIFPTPLVEGITDEQVMADNLSLLEAAKPDSAVISPPGPFKKSTWFEQREKFGFNFKDSIVKPFMEYEYVLYKPLEMWPEMDIQLNGRKFKQLLLQSQQFRNHVEQNLKIPCNLCDEHYLMMRAAGMLTEEGIEEFRKNTLISIVTSDYDYLQGISEKINLYSRNLARSNKGGRSIPSHEEDDQQEVYNGSAVAS